VGNSSLIPQRSKRGFDALRTYSGVKKRFSIQTFFSTTTYAAIPLLGIFKPGALHPVTPAPVKAPTLRVVGDPEHYYGKR
jgi:hypothetical protein